ncbi:MAG: ABC transporter ATP-binding protein [Firmicutes bacterium]|nr:ABC transporter ATP-binding protein [Bacillota bacterium]
MPLLAVNQLKYRYPDGREALKGVSFQINAGEKVGLLGLNGAGKSTLLLSIAGVLKAEGEITLAGVENLKARSKLRKQRIGLVFQDPNDQLFMTTVYEDVAFGPENLGLSRPEVEKRVQVALAAVGAEGFEDRLTHHLSFGEKKRVALATVLAMQPDLLLLDEPSSNLDPKRRREFIEIINQAKQAMLIASHDLELIKATCSRVIILEAGKVVVDEPVAILENEALLRRHELY